MKKIGLNFLDKAIAFVNPQAAVDRLASRAKLTAFEYDATQYNRQRRGPSSLSGAEGFRSNYDRVELLKRSRDLAENVGLVRGLLMKFASHCAGNISYQARTESPKVNSDVEAYWNEWWDKCDLSGRNTGSFLMQIAMMSMLRDGDFLFVLVRDQSGNLKLQGIEADRLGDPNRTYTSLNLISGIHIDQETGAPTGYDIYLRTYGNAYIFQTTIPASQAFHLYDPLRIDQYRGISAFHTAINDCVDLYEIIASEKMAAKLASSQAGIVKRNNNNASDLSTLTNDLNADNQGIKLETIEPGKISYLEVNEDIVFPDGPSRPSGAFAEFHRILLRNICMGVGIPYSFAVDPSMMSGPTARLEMQQAGRTFRRYQKLLEDKVLRPLKNIVIADGVARGLIANNLGSKSTKGIFNFGANVSIDLGRESQANIAEFKAGLTNASQIYSEKGLDFESSIRQRALEAKLIKDLAEQYGLTPDTISDINKPAPAPGFGAPAPAQEQMQDEAQDENAVVVVPPIKEQDTATRTTGSDGDIDVGEEREPTEKGATEDTQNIGGRKIENNLQELSKLDSKSVEMVIGGMLNACELGRYSDIDFTPPQGARESAKRALDVREKKPASQRGMTPVGIARARDLIAGKALSPDTIRRMHSFFSRHEVDKKGSGWDEQGKGWQAWNGWGGDAGFAWVKKLIKQMDSRDEKLEEPASCPIATQDIKTNLANRQNAVDDANYGPANPNEPNEAYWKAKANEFQGNVETAKKMLCGNCAAFNQTSKVLGCIKKGIGADAGEVINGGDLGYCEIFDFKCASKRTCDAWIVGGPITDDKKKVETEFDCGTGSGGFQPGNTCAGGSSSVVAYHGTSKEAADKIDKHGYDLSKSTDGGMWLTPNKGMIESKGVGAGQHGGIVERVIDESKLKLAGWKEYDKYSTDELIRDGYDGAKLVDGDDVSYKIFHPEKLIKVINKSKKLEAFDCGTGAGGFKPGNSCSGGGDGESFDHIGATWRNNENTEKAKQKFDELPDDAIIKVYHGTTKENAKSLISSNKVSVPKGYKSDLPTMGKDSLYIAPTIADAKKYGDEVVEIKVRKKDMLPSQEARQINPKVSLAKAFFNSFDGVILKPGHSFAGIKKIEQNKEFASKSSVDELNPCGQIDDGTFDKENTCAVGYGRPKKEGGYEPKRPVGQPRKDSKKAQPEKKKPSKPATPKETKKEESPKPKEKSEPKSLVPTINKEKSFPAYKKWDDNNKDDVQQREEIKKKLLDAPTENREPLKHEPHRIELVENFENKARTLKLEQSLVTDMNGEPILIKKGTRNRVRFSPDDIEKIKGKNVILTHNHPNNSGLSDADYIFAAKHDIGEFRAVGATKTFTIVRPKEGWPKDKVKFADDVKSAYRETGKLYSNLYQNDKITYDQYRDNWANKTMELIKLKTGVEYEYRRK